MDLELLSGMDESAPAYGQTAGYDYGYGVAGPSYYNYLAGPPVMGYMGAPPPWAHHPAYHPAARGHGFGGRFPGGHAPQQMFHRAPGLPQGFPGGYPPVPAAQPLPMNMLVPAIPGVAQRGGRVQLLGFTPGTFTAASGTALVVRATPQRPIRGGRVFGSFARVGVSATGLLTLSQLIVGTDGQLLSGDPISFDILAPNSFGVGVNLTPAVVGTVIQATVNVSAAPTMTDTIPFAMTIVGPALG